jgi:glycosyltransferase involved in cell wall biosynthesis
MNCAVSDLHESAKPAVILSGVNLREMGPLAVFRDALASLATHYAEQYQIVALVHRRELFETKEVTYLEFPSIASSWLARLQFEYWSLRDLSRKLKPKLWLSMHDITPNVDAEKRAVYCHNPSPFFRVRLGDFLLDHRFALFTLFYRFLYGINIKSNDYVIVQQNWLRQEFKRLYHVSNVVVAHPTLDISIAEPLTRQTPTKGRFRFFYPAAPRIFKNSELCLEAARILETRGFNDFELWLTFDASSNKYSRVVAKKFADVRNVRWMGALTRQRVFELYAEADCLLFPSRLETWGMPISEFRAFGKPILVSDLPYARETAAGYDKVRLFSPDDAVGLADLMAQAATGEPIFGTIPELEIEPPYVRNWSELWALLLDGRK